MKKYYTWVPLLKFLSVVISSLITMFVSFSVLTYRNPYENYSSKISIDKENLTIKDFSVRIYPSDGHEITIIAKKFQNSLSDPFGKLSFHNVHTSIK